VSTSHNVFAADAEHEGERTGIRVPCLGAGSHNVYSFAETDQRSPRPLAVPVRSYPPIVGDRSGGNDCVLRKRSVQPAPRRPQPLDATVRLAPPSFDGLGLGLRHLSGEVQRPAAAEVDTRPGHETSVVGASRG